MADKTTVIVIEDLDSLRLMLVNALRVNGCFVEGAATLAEGRRLLSSLKPSMVILDLGLEDGDGTDIIAQAVKAKVDVMVVSGRDDVTARISCLELGAQDYMTKPIHIREFILRVRRLEEHLNRLKSQEAIVWTGMGVKVDQVRRNILPKGKGLSTAISNVEFSLLQLFSTRPNQTWDRNELARKAGVQANDYDSRALDVAISRLRRKLVAAGYAIEIRSVRGSGYLAAASKTKTDGKHTSTEA